MSDEEIFEKIKLILVDHLGIDGEVITLNSTFVDDLSADSLDIVELIMGVEEEFDISIPDSESERLVTVSDLIEYIKEQKNNENS